MDTKETNIDIYKVSDNSLYLVRSRYNADTTVKVINLLNEKAERVGLKTRFVWLPTEMKLEQFRRP